MTIIDSQLNFYRQRSIVLAAAGTAGADYQLGGVRTFFELISVTADEIQISINDGASFSDFPKGLVYKNFAGVRDLRIRNLSGSANTVVIGEGIGDFQDNRVVFSTTAAIPVDITAQSLVTGVSIKGVSGGTPVAIQDDNLPGVNPLSASFAVSTTTTTAIFSAGANTNGAWIYYMHISSTTATAADVARIDNVTDSIPLLRGVSNGGSISDGLTVRDRPFFLPAAKGLSFVNPAANFSEGFIVYKLVP